jgi:hypothetical protein
MPQVHFEIFRLQGKGGGWSLVEAADDREAAIDQAKHLLAEGRAAAVRVVKLSFQPETGGHASLTIFEDGHIEAKKRNAKLDEDAPPPCAKPADLYSSAARATMARILGEWLTRNRLTVTEFIHSAAALEKFEATGTAFQHAIQKVAVAQAADSELSVAQIVKQLNELCTSAMHRVYKDEKRKLFPELKAGEFGAFAQKLASAPDGPYVLNGTLAKYLAHAQGWGAKLQRVLGLIGELPAQEAGRALLLKVIDAQAADILNGTAALVDLLGHNADLGHALVNLVELFLGTIVHVAEGSGQTINHLAQSFAKDELPEARSAIAARIMGELKGLKRLCPNSLDDEFKMLRRLGNSLVRAQGKYLSHQDLVGAFAERSKRLVTHEPLQQFMASAKTPDEKFERLLTVEENVVGAENKRTLASFIMPIVTSNGFEAQLLAAAPVPQRLRRVVELQERVLRTGFPEIEKNQIAIALDSVALHIDERSKFLASLESRIANPAERAQTLLRFFVAGIFTQGDFTMKARRLLMTSLAKPGFLVSYTEKLGQERHQPIARDAAVAELAAELECTGIAIKDALKVLAA